MANTVRPFTVSATLLTARIVTDSATSPAFTIPVSLEYIRVLIDVSTQATVVSFTLLIELSLDDGITWPQSRSIGRTGGDTAMEASFEWNLPEPTNPLRQIRASLLLSGGNRRLNTSITVQAG